MILYPSRTQHVFAEGPDCLLSDLVVFPLMFIVSEKFIEAGGSENFEQVCDLIRQRTGSAVHLTRLQCEGLASTVLSIHAITVKLCSELLFVTSWKCYSMLANLKFPYLDLFSSELKKSR